MSSAQLDMFGGSKATLLSVVPATRPSVHPTCWEDCLLCGKTPLSYRGKLFYQCTLPGKVNARCFKGDVICDKASLKRKEAPAKPQGAGWADY